MGLLHRRQVIRGAGAAVAVAMIGPGRRALGAPRATIQEARVISHQPELYNGWPTVARRSNGQLLVSCSGGREEHVCPFGRVELMVSDDDGQTWGWPRVLLDSAIDDRDSGVVETAKGSILVTTFTSLAYEGILSRAEKSAQAAKEAEAAGGPKAADKPGWGDKKPAKPAPKPMWPEDRLRRWQAAHRRLKPEQRQAELGEWMVRSTDGGVTWSARYPTIVNSPHGPIQLSDGRLLYAGKELWHGKHRIGVCQSTDDGQSWQWLAEIPTRPGDSHEQYHELHAVETTDGRLVVQIRNHNAKNSHETLQCESSDGGKTWTEPHSIDVWGLPSHLLRLKDGRLLMTYGHRRPPYGNQARVSADGGRTWSEPLIISGDGRGGDLGYPSTVQLADGTLLSVWYEAMKGFPHAVLRQARWTLEG